MTGTGNKKGNPRTTPRKRKLEQPRAGANNSPVAFPVLTVEAAELAIEASAEELAVRASAQETLRARPFRAVRHKSISYAELLDTNLEVLAMHNEPVDVDKLLANLTLNDLNRIVLGKPDLEKLLNAPNFKTTMVGFFLRVQHQSNDVRDYRAIQIQEVLEGPRSYSVGSISTSLVFRSKYGRKSVDVTLDHVSKRKLKEKEFKSWSDVMRSGFLGRKSINKLQLEALIPSLEMIDMKERDMIQLMMGSDPENAQKLGPKMKKKYLEKLDLTEQKSKMKSKSALKRQAMVDKTNELGSMSKKKKVEAEGKATGFSEAEICLNRNTSSKNKTLEKIEEEKILPLDIDLVGTKAVEEIQEGTKDEIEVVDQEDKVDPADIEGDPEELKAFEAEIFLKEGPEESGEKGLIISEDVHADVLEEIKTDSPVPVDYDPSTGKEIVLYDPAVALANAEVTEARNKDEWYEDLLIEDPSSLITERNPRRLLDDPGEILWRLLEKRYAVELFFEGKRKEEEEKKKSARKSHYLLD